MKPFNLEEYLANPSRKIITRSGSGARIVCTDIKTANNSPLTIGAMIEDGGGVEYFWCYTNEGKYLSDGDSDFDLFFVDEIPDFKPYDRVLTRGHNGLPWKANLFSNFKKVGDNTIAVCLKGDYLLRDIIPFDENKVGKTEEV